MAKLPMLDPTLEAVDLALEVNAQGENPRVYLGMSEIGKSCERALFYSFRWFTSPNFGADVLKRFDDGHRGEDIQAERLRMVSGIELETHQENGKQIGFSDLGGHFRGHMDGLIKGLKQDPDRTYVWEHKQVDAKNQAKLEKAKYTAGESEALKEWNKIYHSQAVLYMDYSGLDKHYLTCASAGGRHTVSVTTDKNPTLAEELRNKAESIIFSSVEPRKVKDDPSWFECKFCQHYEVCHFGAAPNKNCRTCRHSKPLESGGWKCQLKSKELQTGEQLAGCDHWAILN